MNVIEQIRRRMHAYVVSNSGNRLYQQTDYSGAIECYRDSLLSVPDAAVVRFNLGLALYKNGERRDARTEWERVLELTEYRNPYLHEQCEIMLRQFS